MARRMSERMACGSPPLGKQLFEGRNGKVLARRLKRLAEAQEAPRMVGEGQRIAVAAVAELELALEVGAPYCLAQLAQ